MWRLHLIKSYALVTGVGLIVLGMFGVLGRTSFFFIPQPAEFADHVLHIGIGLIFLGAWWFIDWVCPVCTDCLPLSHSTSSQSNLFVV